jgi:predicted DCC family thiol-disulfide oxidoreductase YuxK
MCLAGAARFQRFDSGHRLRFVDLHDPHWAAQAASRFSADDLNSEMRVQMPDGTWRTGYFAWAAILENLPVWRWLGRLMRFPLFYGVGPAFYRWVAARRLTISRTLGLPPPCDGNGVCRMVAK